MKFSLKEIRQEIRLKAILWGLFVYLILYFMIAVIIGGGWALYSFVYILKPYLESCGQHCDATASAKYITSAIAPYKRPLGIITTAGALLTVFGLPVLAGFIVGRRTKRAELVNSVVLGAVLLLFSIVGALLTVNHSKPFSAEQTAHASVADYIFMVLMVTIPMTVWGGNIAARKNLNEAV